MLEIHRSRVTPTPSLRQGRFREEGSAKHTVQEPTHPFPIASKSLSLSLLLQCPLPPLQHLLQRKWLPLLLIFSLQKGRLCSLILHFSMFTSPPLPAKALASDSSSTTRPLQQTYRPSKAKPPLNRRHLHPVKDLAELLQTNQSIVSQPNRQLGLSRLALTGSDG